MSFAHPKMLWLMLAVCALLALFFYSGWKKRQRLMEQFIHSRLLTNLTVGLSRRIQVARMWLLVFAVAALLLALARPRWGHGWEESAQLGRDIIVAIDVSKSMLAADVAPDRITRAKLAALDLARLASSDRLGLVAFAGTAFLQCPLTLDEEAFRQSVEIIEPGIIPEGGSSISSAIEAAVAAFKKEESSQKVLILLTDGEAHEENADSVAQKAAEDGLRIFTIGIGTANGNVIQVRDSNGRTSYLKDEQGNVVKSRLNEELLQGIARETDGFYLQLQGANTITTLYERGLAPLATAEFSSKMVRQWKERFQIPLALAIILLLLEMFLPERKKVAGETVGLKRAAAWLLAFSLLSNLALPAEASVRSAQKAYREGNYADALREYEQALQRDPKDAKLLYNAGASAYQAGAYDRAYQHFQGATLTDDLKLQEQAYYNSGNALYRLGEKADAPEKAIATWEQALKQFDAAMKLNDKDEDARFNRDLIQRRLEELKKQQQKQQQQQQKDKNQQGDNKEKKEEQPGESGDQKKGDSEESQDQQQQQQQNNPGDQQQNEEQQKSDQEEQSKDQAAEKEEQEKQQAGNQQDQQQQAQQGDQQKEGQEPQEAGEGQQTATVLGEMTPQQAMQLLEAQKNEERTLIFRPGEPKDPKDRRPGQRKDW